MINAEQITKVIDAQVDFVCENEKEGYIHFDNSEVLEVKVEKFKQNYTVVELLNKEKPEEIWRIYPDNNDNAIKFLKWYIVSKLFFDARDCLAQSKVDGANKALEKANVILNEYKGQLGNFVSKAQSKIKEIQREIEYKF